MTTSSGSSKSSHTTSRLNGLDLARFVAFVGMVIVNFKIAMGAKDDGSLLSVFIGALEGRAAATFVILAGVGLGLATLHANGSKTILLTLKRALFLLVLGLLNSLIFEADILHYYACYFLFGAMLLPLSTRSLAIVILLLNTTFIAMVLLLNYDSGWNWNDYTYSDFWTPVGFVRNLFFNGWHPVIPWLSFLLFGIILSRISLSQAATQYRLIAFGAAAFIFAEAMSALLLGPLSAIDPELGELVKTRPVPPMPLYMLAGTGAALVIIGICLRCSDWLDKTGLLRIVTPAGQQTLTLYIAHILIGMGTLEALGMLGGQTLSAVILAALLFSICAVAYALIWKRLFKRGPIEAAMRLIAG